MQAPYAVFVTRLGGPEVLEPRSLFSTKTL